MIPEYMLDNLATLHSGEEVHPGEAIEEKISLSERFGLWISFYSFDQEQYLIIVQYWLAFLGIAEITPEIRQESLQWALERGSRSGRVAWQFARDFAGRRKTGDN
jgi:predicted AAA+ superfamily ATPase